jgi:hypothetical protein
MKKHGFPYVKDLTMSKGKCTSSISFCNELAHIGISNFFMTCHIPYTLQNLESIHTSIHNYVIALEKIE